MRHTLLVIGLLPLALFSSCKTTDAPPSEIKERWDAANAPTLFGAEPLTYETISQSSYRSGWLGIKPWSDTYWPYERNGFAMRWLDTTSVPAFAISTSLDA